MNSISPLFFDDYRKINCLLSSLNILREVLPELHSYKTIYNLVSIFYNELKFSNNWIIHYIFWELNLLKEIGFDMNLKLNSNYITNYENDMIAVKIDNENIQIPKFLIEKKIKDVENKSVYSALKIIGKFLEKKILIPNNLNYPKSRKILENFYK